MSFETVEIPFVTTGNRQCLTAVQAFERPEIMAFIKRFPKCFAKDYVRDIFWFYPDGDAPETEPLCQS